MNRLSRRVRAHWKSGRHIPMVDLLESRALLSTTTGAAAAATVHPLFELGPLVSSTSPPSGAYTPAEIASAYGFNAISFGGVTGTGAGETIAVVDAYSDPNIQSDLNTFDAQFGLPNTTVTQVSETGSSKLPGTDPTGGWELEESLDVEWAHAMAPGANILLVDASSTGNTDLLDAVSYAAAHANVVSMSWGGSEFSGETSYDKDFDVPGVVFVAASGDSGAPAEWPATSPNVIAVGGTDLTLGAKNSYGSETAWSDSTGGPSEYEAQPSYQKGVVTQTTTQRAAPDVAYDADPSTGVAVYDSYAYEGTSYGWMQVGGTSAGAPQWSALLAVADQGLAVSGQPALNATSPQAVLTTLYQNATSGDFHDITSGTSSGKPKNSAGPGYDYVTGLGSPVANNVVASLVGSATTSPRSDHLVVTVPTTTTAGTSFAVTVTAENASGAQDDSFDGTVVVSGTGAGSLSTADDVTLTNGTATIDVTLDTAGSESITVSGTSLNTVTNSVTVSPGAITRLLLSGVPTTAIAGTQYTITATAEDAYGNVATNASGTVTLATSDTAATLSTGALGDGAVTLSATFATTGTQTLSASIPVGQTTVTSATSNVSVGLPAPSVTATVVSNTQIDLTWPAVPGATGYTVLSSTGGSGYSPVTASPLPAGTTSYDVTNLTAGTTYSFEVEATGANSVSVTSTPVTATTTGGTIVSSSGDTLWSNSYTPPENAYSEGSWDLGVKFVATEAGTITGVRFYQQTWMDGYTHVGYLWSTSGTLLASATFTGGTSYGWEQVSFSKPVTISPGTVYIASFSSGGGYFGITTGYFSQSGYENGPLEALENGADGANGVYGSGNASFPSINGGGMNFWVDVVFSPSSSAPAATKPAANPAATRAGTIGASYVVVPTNLQAGSSVVSVGTSETSGTSQKYVAPTPSTSVPHSTVPQSLASVSSGKGVFSFGGLF